MPIEMPRGLPFSVDTWTPNSKLKRHHFLTHAHKDHCSGITSNSCFPIYSTHITKSLLLQFFPQLDDSMFVEIEVGQSINISDPDGSFLVTAFDANHCPGAVMFLFEGSFGNILHTGDCRLTSDCLQNLPGKYLSRAGKKPSCQLDFVFLDCTFGKSPMKIPSKQSALQQVSNCIWKHPDARTVYLTCDLLGQEELLVHVSNTFGSKIYVDKDNHSEFYKVLELIAPQIISEDPSSTRFHLFEGFPKLYERAKRKISEAQDRMEPEPLIIRPSTQWYACEETELTVMERKILEKSNIPVKDGSGVWHICYSMHSSRQELEWALELLEPKWVVSTTPECRAMELEYVRKNCDTRAADTLFWKLLDISDGERSLPEDASIISSKCCLSTEEKEPQKQAEIEIVSCKKRVVLNLSPFKKKPTVTLFGRARLGHDACISGMAANSQCGSRQTVEDIKVSATLHDNPRSENEGDNKGLEGETSSAAVSVTESDKLVVSRYSAVVSQSISYSSNRPTNGGLSENLRRSYRSDATVTTESDKLRETTYCGVSQSVSYSSNRSRNGGLSDNLRKFYRSMNAPVPQPLPSLVELMKGIKRSKTQS